MAYLEILVAFEGLVTQWALVGAQVTVCDAVCSQRALGRVDA